MKFFKNFLKELLSPIGIAIAVMHWIVVAYSLSFEETHMFSKSVTFDDYTEPTLFPWLLYLNTPSLLTIEFIVHPVLSVFGRNLLTESLGLLILICFITFQWLIICYAANSIYNLFKPKKLKFSLNDK